MSGRGCKLGGVRSSSMTVLPDCAGIREGGCCASPCQLAGGSPAAGAMGHRGNGCRSSLGVNAVQPCRQLGWLGIGCMRCMLLGGQESGQVAQEPFI